MNVSTSYAQCVLGAGWKHVKLTLDKCPGFDYILKSSVRIYTARLLWRGSIIIEESANEFLSQVSERIELHEAGASHTSLCHNIQKSRATTRTREIVFRLRISDESDYILPERQKRSTMIYLLSTKDLFRDMPQVGFERGKGGVQLFPPARHLFPLNQPFISPNQPFISSNQPFIPHLSFISDGRSILVKIQFADSPSEVLTARDTTPRTIPGDICECLSTPNGAEWTGNEVAPKGLREVKSRIFSPGGACRERCSAACCASKEEHFDRSCVGRKGRRSP